MSLSKATANTSPSVPEGVRPAVQFLTVSENNEAQRIDNFLFAQVKGIPKSKIYRVIRKGEVRINKKRCKPETKLVVGDVVRGSVASELRHITMVPVLMVRAGKAKA